MTARPITGAGQPTTRHHALPEAQRNSLSFAADPSLPRSPFAQAVLDVIAVVFLFFLASVAGLAVTAAIFALLFVRF